MSKRKPHKDIVLVVTCGACPEQYDAFYNGELIGYLRLRHGYFYVAEAPGKEPIWETTKVYGDGIFDPEERPRILKKARKALAKYYGL